jgi:hypothetical protein
MLDAGRSTLGDPVRTYIAPAMNIKKKVIAWKSEALQGQQVSFAVSN